MIIGRWVVVVFFLQILTGCATNTQAIRTAPKDGFEVTGLHAVFVTVPMTAKRTSGFTNREDGSLANINLEGFISAKLPGLLRAKGIETSYRAVTMLPNGRLTDHADLRATEGRHVLLITPVRATRLCSYGCSTAVTALISLHSPNFRYELWKVSMTQSEFSQIDSVAGRNDPFIEDIAKAVLDVVRAKRIP